MNHEISIQTLCRGLRPAALAVALLLAVGAAADGVSVQWQDSTSLRLAFTVTDGKGIGSNYSVWATPMLTNGRGDTLRLGSTVFRGKRNMRYVARQRYYGTMDAAEGNEVSAGTAVNYDVNISRAEHPWLWDGKVNVGAERTKEGCCDVIPLPGIVHHRVYRCVDFRPCRHVFDIIPVHTAEKDNIVRVQHPGTAVLPQHVGQ